MSKFKPIHLSLILFLLPLVLFGQDFQIEYNQYNSTGEIITPTSYSVQNIAEEGFSWLQIGPASITPTSIAINPFVEDIILVGTINGLLNSTDGGDTWEQVDFGSEMPLHDVRINEVKFSPVDTNLVVLTATNLLNRQENKVLISRDRGTTWVEAITSTSMVRGEIYLSSTDSDIMFVEAGTLRKSTSAGMFWSEINDFIYVQSFNINPNNEEQIYVLNYNDLYKTVDNGVFWENVSDAINFSKCVKTSPLDNDIVFLGKAKPDEGFMKSIDGGQTWENIGEAFPNGQYIDNIQFDPVNQNDLYISGPNSGLLKLTNLGESFTPLMSSINDRYIRSVGFFQNSEIAVSAGSNIYFSSGNRTAWSKKVDTVNGADIFEIHFNPEDGNTVYTAAFGGVFKTTDAGISWTQLVEGMPDTDVFTLAIDQQNPANLLAGTFMGYIIRSADAGETWLEVFKTDTTKESNTEAMQDIYFHPTNSGLAWAVSTKHTYKSLDGGFEWKELILDQDSTDIYGGIAISPSEPAVIYLSDKERSNLYKSIDTGTTWIKIDSLHSISKLIVHPDSSNVLYGQIDGDLRNSRNGGETWVNLKSNLSFTDIYIPPLQSHKVLISTFGQGVLSMPDTGAVRTTSAINIGLNTNLINMVRQFPADTNKFIAATFGQSLYISGYEITSIDKEQTLPGEYTLQQNYPNPFNPSTTIEFTLVANSRVKLIVYNILGAVVKTLVNGDLSSGYHKYNFDGRDLSSGIYFYRLETDKSHLTKKMILLK
ncbi:MAG: T9SS type A sorting domain-containing protein [Bacteroidetes bacterium]|nr:T9SS type A sorting domain-containing protein [Bacteroidota bacterium]